MPAFRASATESSSNVSSRADLDQQGRQPAEIAVDWRGVRMARISTAEIPLRHHSNGFAFALSDPLLPDR